MPDYDLVVVGSGFAGSTATLSFLEAADKAGQAGRVALIEAGKRGTWPGGSRWTRPFLRLDRDDTLFERARAERVGAEACRSLDYWRKLEDEVPDTVEFMEDHGVKLIHHDEENAALDFEEQHFAHPTGGGKEIADNYLILIAKYETADIFYGHEATELTLDDEGRIGGVVVREPDGGQRHITAGTAGQFDMFHAELVDPRAKTPHSVIWAPGTTGSWSTRIANASTTRARTTSSPPPSPSRTTPGVTRTRSRTSSPTRP